MKDLKHLLYFENLLQNANNELIEQAKQDGRICASCPCEKLPEPLLNLGDAFSVRLFAPNSGSLDIATYYMTSFLCETSRALLERAI
ncbi:MAG: 2-hydroxyacyl-CoA dehydratase, partial [Mogibacterium sp.]|nr:2-hydroxyacyl-CoA dehydratase [Mogibacterium sp.]